MKRIEKITLTIFGIMVLSGPSIIAQKIVAHRGASHLAPENTLSAVELGYELGAQAVEIDIHLTKDERIVVNHDHTSGRTSGVDYTIKDTESKELRKLDVGAWKSEKYKGEKMPFLEEVLKVVPEGRTLVVEIKTGPEILPFLREEVEKSGITDRLELISFNLEAIIGGKKMFPNIPAYWLLGNFNTHSQEEAIKIAKENDLNGLDVHYKLVTPDFLQAMADAGLEVYAYTINDVEIGKAMKEAKVDAITTDMPKLMAEGLKLN